jgi:hypothetical protein
MRRLLPKIAISKGVSEAAEKLARESGESKANETPR